MGHNSKQSKTVKEYSNRTASLTNELQSMQFQKEKQVNLLLNKIDLQEEAVRHTNRTMSDKMKKLQNALEDRMSTMSSLTSRLSIAEADLALAEQKCSDLEHALQKSQTDKENETRLINSKTKREKEVCSLFKCIKSIQNFKIKNLIGTYKRQVEARARIERFKPATQSVHG